MKILKLFDILQATQIPDLGALSHGEDMNLLLPLPPFHSNTFQAAHCTTGSGKITFLYTNVT